MAFGLCYSNCHSRFEDPVHMTVVVKVGCPERALGWVAPASGSSGSTLAPTCSLRKKKSRWRKSRGEERWRLRRVLYR